MSLKDLEDQLTRWMERFQQYDFEITRMSYIKMLMADYPDALVKTRSANIVQG